MKSTETNQLPQVDTEPDEWGPEHDDITATPEELQLGNDQGFVIDPDDDEDNGQ